MSITNEKLPKLCFRCERITHDRGAYSGMERLGENPTGQYGPWLQVEGGRKSDRSKQSYGPSPSSSTDKTKAFDVR